MATFSGHKISIFGTSLVSICIWLIFTDSVIFAAENDIECLRSIKDSLEDPLKSLESSWNFNASRGSICSFTGIQCWHENDDKIVSIHLSNMGLKGEFPRGIARCSSLNILDLSKNEINGTIPNNISMLIPFVTTLDLSSNKLSGGIPEDLANCSYLNILKLDNNQLSGLIPPRIGLLGRMKTFSVSNNRLTGPVPIFLNASIPPESYAHNAGLCGGNLTSCHGLSTKSYSSIIVGAVVGGLVFTVLCGFSIFFLLCMKSRKKKKDDRLSNSWAKGFKSIKHTKISVFDNSVAKMNLNDLIKATDEFKKENIISHGRTGTMYRGLLDNGSSLIVKRLNHTQHSEKEFLSEMRTLGTVKHPNLVPLLGFCTAKKERLLVYKNMPNGMLHDKLHSVKDLDRVMDWPCRLRIGIQAAKGFAWLHHNCNPRILHRNISSKCILLDSDYEPKISDFGLARLMNPVDTHLSTLVNGEFGELGYVAPEYARTLMATPKGDVYSFGVVLLELVTGENPTKLVRACENFNGSLVEWVLHLSSMSKLLEAFDSPLRGKGHESELLQFIKVACSCVQPGPKERPFMLEVFQLLRAIGQTYNFDEEDDALLLSEAGDAEKLVELIVARDT